MAAMPATPLKPVHALLALSVIAVWGTNFVIMKFALGALPPVKIHCAQLVEGALRSALSGRRRSRRRGSIGP